VKNTNAGALKKYRVMAKN